MSEGQSPTAALTESTQSLDPTSQDIELVHQIVRRAQDEPLADDRLSLLTAYGAVFHEKGLDIEQDRVCLWLLLEILKPDVQGDTLYAKFEDVLRKRGIVLEFTDDDSRPQTQHTNLDLDKDASASCTAASRRVSTSSQRSANGQVVGNIARHHAVISDEDLNRTPPGYDRLVQTAIAMDSRSLMHDFLEALRGGLPQRDLRAMEQTAQQVYERKLKYKALTHWYNVQQQNAYDYATAAAHHQRNTRSGAFTRLFDSARVNRMHAMEEERLRGMSLYKLAIITREQVFLRKHEARLKQRCVSKLINASRNVSARNHFFEDVLEQRQVQSDGKLRQLAVSSIYAVAQEQFISEASAVDYHEARLKTKILFRLRQTMHQAMERENTARDLREFYLMRKYFSRLYYVSQERKDRRLQLSREYFARWRRQAARKRDARLWDLLKTCRRRYKMNLAMKCLQKMNDQSQSNLRNQQQADQIQIDKVNRYAHGVIVTWYTRSHEIKRHHDGEAVEYVNERVLRRVTTAMIDWKQRQQQLENKANQFHNLHVQDISSKCFRAMSRKIFAIRRRQNDADAFRERHLRQMGRHAFEIWRRRAAESRGEGPLVLPPATPSQRRAYQLSQLASTTPLLPPETSFAARLRGEVKVTGEAQDEDDEDT